MDQLVKRRAKSGLIRVKVDWSGAQEFVTQHLDKEIKVNQNLLNNKTVKSERERGHQELYVIKNCNYIKKCFQ